MENAASVHSNLGGGNLGYLGLVVSPEKYLTILGDIDFVEHPNPPTLLPIPANATQP